MLLVSLRNLLETIQHIEYFLSDIANGLIKTKRGLDYGAVQNCTLNLSAWEIILVDCIIICIKVENSFIILISWEQIFHNCNHIIYHFRVKGCVWYVHHEYQHILGRRSIEIAKYKNNCTFQHQAFGNWDHLAHRSSNQY